MKRAVRFVLMLSLVAVHGCAQRAEESERHQLSPGDAIVIVAPAGKTTPKQILTGGPNFLRDRVAFRFQREGRKDESPIFLEIIGEADQSMKVYPVQSGVYRLVAVQLPGRRVETRWPFKEAPNKLEVRDGEAVYVGTLHWRDTWVEVVNNEAEARTVFRKRLRPLKGRPLKFVTRLVKETAHSR